MLFHYLFFVGSIGGFFLELFYRKVVFKNWIKPGVFKGFYLPLYGMGLVICYCCYLLPVWLVFRLILAVLCLTFIELMCGFIFIKGFKIPLWDYSNQFLNYKGLICLKFSLFWLMLVCLAFLLFDYVVAEPNIFFNIIVFSFELVLLFDGVVFFVTYKKKDIRLDL